MNVIQRKCHTFFYLTSTTDRKELINIFVHCFKRFKQNLEIPNKIISIKIWLSIIDKYFSKFLFTNK